MTALFHLAGVAVALGGPPQKASGSTEAVDTIAPIVVATVPDPPRRGALGRYLARPVAPSARFLDHGVLELGVAPGYPQIYRVEAAIGLLDHVRVGVTAHWLGSEPRPIWAPQLSVAFVRLRKFEAGARYERLIHPPPVEGERGEDATKPFQESTEYFLSTASFSQSWYTVGFDVGAIHYAVADVFEQDVDLDYVERVELAGGLYLRVGNRRFGVTLQGLMPQHTVEAVFDVRFGILERRPRGRWFEPVP